MYGNTFTTNVNINDEVEIITNSITNDAKIENIIGSAFFLKDNKVFINEITLNNDYNWNRPIMKNLLSEKKKEGNKEYRTISKKDAIDNLIIFENSLVNEQSLTKAVMLFGECKNINNEKPSVEMKSLLLLDIDDELKLHTDSYVGLNESIFKLYINILQKRKNLNNIEKQFLMLNLIPYAIPIDTCLIQHNPYIYDYNWKTSKNTYPMYDSLLSIIATSLMFKAYHSRVNDYNEINLNDLENPEDYLTDIK